MKRFITRPNSKIDKRILLVIYLLSYINVSYLLYSDITTWWLDLILEVVTSTMILLIIGFLYYRKYDKDFVNIRLSEKVSSYLFVSYIPELNRNFFDIPKACKLIDEICNAIIVPIEQRKVLYDQMCRIWTECGGDSIYKVYSVPVFITEKWKRAVIEYKKYEIDND